MNRVTHTNEQTHTIENADTHYQSHLQCNFIPTILNIYSKQSQNKLIFMHAKLLKSRKKIYHKKRAFCGLKCRRIVCHYIDLHTFHSMFQSGESLALTFFLHSSSSILITSSQQSISREIQKHFDFTLSEHRWCNSIYKYTQFMCNFIYSNVLIRNGNTYGDFGELMQLWCEDID